MQEIPAALFAKRHSVAHILAAAINALYPGVKFGVGPVIDNGYYYDLQTSTPLSEADFAAIESKMREIITSHVAFVRSEMPIDDAISYFADKGQEFKIELLRDLKSKGTTSLKEEEAEVLGDAAQVSLYTTGDFTDLCRGPHIGNTSEINPEGIRLIKIAGAYWRGDENNPMLTRIYGVYFEKKEELDAYVAMMEEAALRDHRKLGRELKLFTVSDLIGAGLPLMQPKGMIVRGEIEKYLWELHADRGYQRVWTPHIAKLALYETSGHAEKFGDELFKVKGKEDDFILKPMNCPHHMQIFADNQFSYRDMPVRYFEPATVYRDEKSGQLGGLTRVRAITQDDGHLFCRVTQINEEVSMIVEIIKDFYTTMGMMDGYWVRLSTRGPNGKYMGSDEVWQQAEAALETAAKTNNLNYKLGPDEAAFYGPKLDFMFKDAIGREHQLATIQCDFNLPERFELEFTNEKGEKERPVVIHRAISGSLERFMGVMIEHFAGQFPVWLSPVQVKLLPINDDLISYAHEIATVLRKSDVRVEIDDRAESLGKKIRQAEVEKVPYSLVLGAKEKEAGMIAVRSKKDGDLGQMTVAEFAARIVEEIKTRKL